MNAKLILGILVILIITQCSNPNTSENSTSESNFANGIQLADLDGKIIKLSDYKGKTIILNVWATWCKPCIKELPSMEVLQANLDPTDYVLLFASDEEVVRINKFVGRNNYDLKFISLKSSPESLGIASLPTTFIIDGNGELMVTESGSKDWGSSESIQEIKNLSK
jgi:thiol-disulfide isomerase/thioredoxin